MDAQLMSESSENPKVPRRLAAILAADIAAYSALMGADEADTVRSLKQHQAVVLPMIKERGGRIIDTAGDGILAEFGSVVSAAECAVAIQRTMAERNADVEEARRMRFRIGINQGDVVFDDTRVYGDGVNVAARLENLAEPGGICISRKVYEDISGKMKLAFVDLGEQQLKNIAQAVRVYRVSGEQLAAARATAKPALALPDKPSIAVLPFKNLSGDTEQEYFADGMVEDIISGLSRFRWLFVIARNSSFTYKGRAVDVKQVGRELGVRYLLEGSVRKSANRVRIAGQLIDAASGTHLWADRFEGTIEDVFELQDQVTARVVWAIAPRLQQAEIERARRKPTESLDAYDLYLRGLANVHKWTREGNEEALRLFYQAVERDPDFSAAYVAAASCFARRKSFGWVIDREQEAAEARRLARRAVQLGKDDANVLGFAGYALAYVARELDDGAALLDEALLINPNLAWGWGASGWVKVWLGEPDQAVERFAHAMRLNPIDPAIFGMQQGTAYAHFFADRYDEAITWAKMALRELPDSHGGLRIAAASCALAGRDEEAKRLMARLLEIDPALGISKFVQNIRGPYRQREHAAKFTDALRKAGLPE
jgi:TolB-like protein/class 3 adenylate cyclase/Tfp pilus assembly protein PilF